MTENKGEIIIYIKEDGHTQIDGILQGNSLAEKESSEEVPLSRKVQHTSKFA